MDEKTNVTAGGDKAGETSTAQSNLQEQKSGNAVEPKTYSEKDFKSEVDRRVTEALKTAQGKWQTEYEEKLKTEKDEAARLAKMSAEDRAKAELDKERKQFDEERSKHQRERLEFECTKLLASESLPVDFAQMLTGTDAEATKSNIETFKGAFMKAVEAAVSERLKGSTPKTPTQQTDTDPFLQGFGNQ